MMNLFIASENASESPFDIKFLTLGTAIVVFVIFLFIAMKFVWPHILNGLDQREQKLRGDLDAAEEARQQAKSALDEYEQALSKARSEATEMIAKAKQDAKAAAEELRSNNTKELANLKLAAAADIESAKQAAIGELHAEASTLAVAIAGKILGREISASDQQSLVDESLSELSRLSS
jgi:F-type H+-transporting ATPase subunit b